MTITFQDRTDVRTFETFTEAACALAMSVHTDTNSEAKLFDDTDIQIPTEKIVPFAVSYVDMLRAVIKAGHASKQERRLFIALNEFILVSKI